MASSLATKTPTTKFLTPSHLLLLNRLLETQTPYNAHLLSSAAHRPTAKAHYLSITNPTTLGASLTYGIIKNHAFSNANKRTAMLAGLVFLGQKWDTREGGEETRWERSGSSGGSLGVRMRDLEEVVVAVAGGGDEDEVGEERLDRALRGVDE